MAVMEGQRRIVASLDDAAEKFGLTVGMSITHAQSLVPNLVIVNAMFDADDAALTRLASWCTMFSPLVSVDPPNGVFIDVAGSAHLFRGEAALLKDLLKRLTQAQITAKAVVADTPGCAWAVARFGNATIVQPGRSADAIASLPVAALRIAPQTVASLREVGIERVAHIASKPRSSLHLRFGGEVLLRFDQATGSLQEALTTLPVAEMPAVTLRFAEPVADPDDLKRIIKRLCQMLCKELERRGIGARRLDLVFCRIDNLAQAVRVGLSRPHRDSAHFTKLLIERLVQVEPGFGIESAGLTASWVEALTERQTVGRNLGSEGSDVDVSQLVDTLGARMGPSKIFRLTSAETDLPERSVKKVAPLQPAVATGWPKHLPRPARLFEVPQKIEAVAEWPDHPPRLFIWRNVRHRVMKADGPERIHGDWWINDRETDLVRDYYRVETADGARYWLFRDGPVGQGSWWLHGVGEA